MAFLDTEQGHLVVHIVFDGSPLAGKTTTMHSLASSLGVDVESPEQMLGRTLFFDWLEYTGGLWNGHRIRCHVLSVPGQSSLGARRFELLRMADCVVFVFDTSSTQIRQSLNALEELGCVLGTFPDPRPRTLIQLNKRDLPNALPRAQLDEMLPVDFQDIAETTATGSAGIRDVFIRAVRLALSRVEILQEQGNLPRRRPKLTESGDLLKALRNSDRGVHEAVNQAVPVESAAWNYLNDLGSSGAPSAPRHSGSADGRVQVREDQETVSSETVSPETVSSETVSSETVSPHGAPLPPSATVPAGAVWPPTRGRADLQDIAELPSRLQRLANGDWSIELGNAWRGLSRNEYLFREFDQGRQRLLKLTRMAIDTEEWLSPGRCLVLSPADENDWRLWELMPFTPALDDLLVRRLEAPQDVLVAALVQVFRLYHRAAREWPEQRLKQTLSPSHCGLHQAKLVYTGFLAASSSPASPASSPSASAGGGQDPSDEKLRSLALRYLKAQGLPLDQAIRQLEALGANVPGLATMAEHLARSLSSPSPLAEGSPEPSTEALSSS